ncbi:MAG: M1 family metallopeptidase [Deltaproteobacteria bacterium]|nr:M1 family metallopeptidase [Deltaproteobacteria bacterium]
MHRRRPWLHTAVGLLLAVVALVVQSRTASFAASAAYRRPALRWVVAQTAPIPSAGSDVQPTEEPPAATAGSLDGPTVRYQMSARLDPVEHQVRGEATIRWRNRSQVAQQELYLHLYLNAFKNERTQFMRNPAGAGFRGGGKPSRWGYVTVERLYARELSRDLWPDAERHSPGDEADETDLRVPLPEPVAPGGELTLEVRWVAQLPSLVMRTGFHERFHMVAQWFPKLARLEPDGRWAHFPFHRLSEFYADFGSYDVRIDVPEGYVVGATGRQQDETRSEAGRVVHRFVAERVHDFAFTAWDQFEELRRVGPAGVELRCLYPPGEAALAQLELDVADRGMRRMSALYGAYPYDTLTVVHPPQGAGEAGGMEYPTLITTGGRWYWPTLGARFIESVTVHELAHQWFYGLLGSNEHRWPFLDEGLTTYATAEVMEAWWPARSAVHSLGFSLSQPAFLRMAAAEVGSHGPIAQPATGFVSGADYGRLVYSRAATLLATLGRVHGEAALARALGRYARTHRFGHPTPDDLLAAVAAEMGKGPAATLKTGLFDGGWVDYQVLELVSAESEPAGGVFGDPAAPAPAPKVTAPYSGYATVVRRGSLTFPVDVALHDAAGDVTIVSWDGAAERHEIPFAGPSPLTAVVIDPDHRVLLDQDLTNNVRSAEPRRLAPRVLTHGAFAVQLALALVAP